MQAGVPVAVGDEHVAGLGYRNSRGQVEGPGGLVDDPILRAVPGLRGLAPRTQGQQELLVRRVLLHHMGVAVGHVDVAVGADVHPVGVVEGLGPSLDEAASPVKHHHLVAAAVEQVDVVVLVHRHSGHLVELVALGQPSPVFCQVVDVVPASVGHL